MAAQAQHEYYAQQQQLQQHAHLQHHHQQQQQQAGQRQTGQHPQQPQPQPPGSAAPAIEPIHVAARHGPAQSSRVGSLFWPHMVPSPSSFVSEMQASSRRRSRRDAGLTEDDRRLEAELGLRRVAEAKRAKTLSGSGQDAIGQPSSPADILPSTRAIASCPSGRWWAASSYAGADELQQLGKLPAEDSTSPPVVAPTPEGVLRGLVTDELTCAMLRPATAAVLIRAGFDRTQASALETLAEVFRLTVFQLTSLFILLVYRFILDQSEHALPVLFATMVLLAVHIRVSPAAVPGHATMC
eukprot:COSAG02_NODE_1408_length_12764_cov_254.164627_5_plen_298_part_00